jgi:hypothetical protein
MKSKFPQSSTPIRISRWPNGSDEAVQLFYYYYFFNNMKIVPHVPEGDNAERHSPTSFHDDEDIVDISEQSHLATAPNRKGSIQALGNVSGVITNVHDPKTPKHPTPATAPPTPLAPEVNISSSSLRRPLDPPEVIIWLYICLAQNKNVPTCQPDVKLPLCNLTKRDVADIASGLHYNLTHEVNEEEAGEEVKEKRPRFAVY